MPRTTHPTRKRGMAKWQSHREAVKEVLKRRKKSTYWLSQQLAGTMSRDLVYSYLRGRYNISQDNQDAMSKALGIRFTDE